MKLQSTYEIYACATNRYPHPCPHPNNVDPNCHANANQYRGTNRYLYPSADSNANYR